MNENTRRKGVWSYTINTRLNPLIYAISETEERVEEDPSHRRSSQREEKLMKNITKKIF